MLIQAAKISAGSELPVSGLSADPWIALATPPVFDSSQRLR
jgi:hypothetical protein